MFDPHIKNDGIARSYAEVVLSHALYQALELPVEPSIRWRVFILILEIEGDPSRLCSREGEHLLQLCDHQKEQHGKPWGT